MNLPRICSLLISINFTFIIIYTYFLLTVVILLQCSIMAHAVWNVYTGSLFSKSYHFLCGALFPILKFTNHSKILHYFVYIIYMRVFQTNFLLIILCYLFSSSYIVSFFFHLYFRMFSFIKSIFNNNIQLRKHVV